MFQKLNNLFVFRLLFRDDPPIHKKITWKTPFIQIPASLLILEQNPPEKLSTDS